MPALPTHPSLRHLKNEAKDLHKALKSGAAEAVDRVREHLPRLDRGETDAAGVTLQEVQHALAQEYEYKTWAGLVSAVETPFTSLAALADEDILVILRELDQKDIVVSLKEVHDEAEEAVRERILSCMSERVRTFISEEIEYLGPMPLSEVEEVRRRIVLHVARLGDEGRIAWPPGSEDGARQSQPAPAKPPALKFAQQPLEGLAIDEVRAVCHGLLEMARDHGILSLEAVIEDGVSPYIDEAVRLTVDGTPPDLLRDMMGMRRETLVHHLRTRLTMILEGTVGIRAGDNPRILVHKLHVLHTVYSEGGAEYREEEGTAEQLRTRVAATPVSAMSLDELTMIVRDVSEISRRQGYAALSELLDVIDDELLREGLQMAVDGVDGDEMAARLRKRIDEAVRDAEVRYRLVGECMVAITQAKDEKALDEVMDAVSPR